MRKWFICFFFCTASTYTYTLLFVVCVWCVCVVCACVCVRACVYACVCVCVCVCVLSLIHIPELTRLRGISYAVFCLKKKILHTSPISPYMNILFMPLSYRTHNTYKTILKTEFNHLITQTKNI